MSGSSASGKLYRLDRGTNLLDLPPFPVTVRTHTRALPPAMNTETDTTAAGAGPWFYRVRLEP